MSMQEIGPQDLVRMRANGTEFQLIDVREPYEAEIGTIGGTLIPMGTIIERLAEVRRDVPVVVHCKSGSRSAAVVQALSTRYGFDNLINLQGGILAYAEQVDPQIRCG